MKRNVFNSRRLYIANIVFSLILLALTIISLYFVIYRLADDIRTENQNLELVLYSVYFLIYILALIVLFLRRRKTIIYLNIIFLLAITLNVIDYNIHYSEHKSSLIKYISLCITISIISVFSLIMYLNNRKKHDSSLLELDEIGNQQN